MSTTASLEERIVATAPKSLFIGGRWRPGETDGTLTVEDPSRGEPLCEVADATEHDAAAALDAAAAAQPAWARSAPRERAAILRRAYEAVRARRDELALLVTLEMGKPLGESLDEVDYAAEYLAWFSEEAIRVDGRYAVAPDGSGRILVMQQPVGPCLVITPWNFPLVMATRAIAPAIAAGCTMVVKPSRLTPLGTLCIAGAMEAAGLPAGVLNVIVSSSSSAVIDPLLADHRLRKLTFTGSTKIGSELIERSARQVLRVSMELGGNAPFIVFDDSDLDAAVDGALGAKIRNVGEACTSANRFLVQRGVARPFTDRLAGRMSRLRIGRGTDDSAQVGPMIDARQRERVQRLVDDARMRGGRILTGGEPVAGKGYFYPPTLIADVPPDARCCQEEIFGPVAPVTVFDTEEEAIALANDTDYGLAGYVYTESFHRALRMVEALETGMVGLNQGRVSNPMAPFGGVKRSGLGRAGGPEAISEYLETKYVAIHHGRS